MFIDCERLRIERLGGINAKQTSCSSENKCIPFLRYKTITIPYGIMFAMYVPEEGRTNDMNLIRKSGIYEKLEKYVIVNGVKYYI